MGRVWSFVGGLMFVTTITYLNMTTITIIAKDIQTSLIRERKKLDDARNNSTQSTSSTATTTTTASAQQPPKLGDIIKWPTTTRVADRMKKIWNEDIERSVRRMQNTDWERMGRAVEGHMKRARERMASSFERMGEDSKKNST
jgi:Altered inheritance of mitochondria 5